ncbi:MAG: alpha/beta hydrolase [Filomicrobium sp.]
MSDFVELSDGRRFGLATYGAADGLPVLALHGAPASRIMFDVTDKAAKKLGLRILCPERPGYGVTEKEATAPTLANRAADLEKIADRLTLGRFAVLGVSGGGPYAVALAERVGERVLGVGLVSPMGPIAEFHAAQKNGEIDNEFGRLSHGHKVFFLNLIEHKTLFAAQAKMSAAAFQAAPQSFAYLFAKILSSGDSQVLKQPHVQESLIAMTLEALRQGISGGLGDMEIFSKPWNLDLERVTQPTVMWQGTADRIVPAPVTYWLASRLPNARLEKLPDAGHFWVYDHVSDVLETLAGISRRD